MENLETSNAALSADTGSKIATLGQVKNVLDYSKDKITELKGDLNGYQTEIAVKYYKIVFDEVVNPQDSSVTESAAITEVSLIDTFGISKTIKNAVADSIYNDNVRYADTNVFDGDMNTMWSSAGGVAHILILALTEPSVIRKIGIIPRCDNLSYGVPNNMTFYASKDNVNWTEVGKYSDQKDGWESGVFRYFDLYPIHEIIHPIHNDIKSTFGEYLISKEEIEKSVRLYNFDDDNVRIGCLIGGSLEIGKSILDAQSTWNKRNIVKIPCVANRIYVTVDSQRGSLLSDFIAVTDKDDIVQSIFFKRYNDTTIIPDIDGYIYMSFLRLTRTDSRIWVYEKTDDNVRGVITPDVFDEFGNFTDSEKINKSLALLSANGGGTLLLTRKYIITEPILIQKSSLYSTIHIIGIGADSELYFEGENTTFSLNSWIECKGGSDYQGSVPLTVFENIQFTTNNATLALALCAKIKCINCVFDGFSTVIGSEVATLQQIYFNDCEFYNISDCVCKARFHTVVVFKGCTVEKCGQFIKFKHTASGGSSFYTVIDNCVMQFLSSENPVIYIDGGGCIDIINNYFETEKGFSKLQIDLSNYNTTDSSYTSDPGMGGINICNNLVDLGHAHAFIPAESFFIKLPSKNLRNDAWKSRTEHIWGRIHGNVIGSPGAMINFEYENNETIPFIISGNRAIHFSAPYHNPVLTHSLVSIDGGDYE